MFEDAQLLLIDALQPCNYPSIKAVAPNLWLKISKKLGLKPRDLVIQQASKLKQIYIEDFQNTLVNISV